jgi:tetratricopeptide (TPR) repeat protein
MDLVVAIARADNLYRQRANIEAVKESVALLAGLDGGAEVYEAQWRLARALFFLGQEADSRAAKKLLHATAIGSGKRAVARNSERVEGRFWLGVNLALFAESAKGLRALRALIGAKGELERASRISQEYHDAGPLRVLGRLKHKAPWFVGGSLSRSREYFDRALSIAPRNSVTLIYAAELARDTGDRRRAVELLNQIIALPDDTDWEFELCRDRRIAREMIEKLGR